MVRTIVLHGSLAEQFQEHVIFDFKTASEAVRALCGLFENFRNALLDGEYQILWSPNGVDISLGLGTLALEHEFGDLHIVPVISGSGGGRNLTASIELIAGAALLATAFVLAPEAGLLTAAGGGLFGADLSATAVSLGGLMAVTYGNLATLGFGMVLLGAGQLLAPKPADSTNAALDSSALFSSPGNISTQGIAVPAIFGRFLVGSIVVSQGISNSNVLVGQTALGLIVGSGSPGAEF